MLQTVHMAGDAKQILNMVSNLMCNHVGLGKVARCAEPSGQFLKKRKIQIRLVIAGAVEGAHGG